MGRTGVPHNERPLALALPVADCVLRIYCHASACQGAKDLVEQGGVGEGALDSDARCQAGAFLQADYRPIPLGLRPSPFSYRPECSVRPWWKMRTALGSPSGRTVSVCRRRLSQMLCRLPLMTVIASMPKEEIWKALGGGVEQRQVYLACCRFYISSL